MNKDEILEKSRAENKNQDIYEKEVLKQSYYWSLLVMMILALVFLIAQVFTDGGLNYGLYALILSGAAASNWVKYAKLKQKKDRILAALQTACTAMLAACHLYTLLAAAAIH